MASSFHRFECVLVIFFFVTAFPLVHCEVEEAHVTENDDSQLENSTDVEFNEDFVLQLTAESFEDAVNKNNIVLVEFYTQGCDVCKQLAPQFAAAAEELVKNDPPVTLAKVDAAAHAELAQRFEVVGYPTLKFFINGQEHEYDGPGNKEGIIEYMKRVSHPDWKPATIALTTDNFYDVVNTENLMLVGFYVPGCSGCVKFSRILEIAAKELKKGDPPILIAKVDASVETELAKKYNIITYPTLKVFKKGRAVDFRGDRSHPYDIMYYMKKQLGEGAREIKNAKMLRDLLVPDEISVVGFFSSRDNPKAEVYTDLATEIRDDFNFGIVFDDDLRKTYNVRPNSVVVFTGERFHTKYEPKWYAMEIKEETTPEDILDFLKDHHLPLVGHYIRPLTNHYDKKRPLCLVFYSVDFSFEYRNETQLWRHKIADVAVQFPDFTFAIVDDEEEKDLLQKFGLEESGAEINIALFGTDGKKYAMEPMDDDFDADAIAEFLNKYKKGKLKPYIKSQRVPKKQTGPLTVVVGETFEQIVFDSTKDVLIELYSPWCEHCRQLESTLEILARKFKDSNLVIAKMDATTNDLPENYSAPGYPTIYFAVANNKTAPLKYEGPREAGDIEKFIRDNAVVSLEKKEEL